MVFEYTSEATDYLSAKDAKLCDAIEAIGKIERSVMPNVFSCIVNSIVGQQISTKAQQTIWARMQSSMGEITPESVLKMPAEEIQQFGLSFRKVSYIQSAAEKAHSGELDLNTLAQLSDEDICQKLCALPGIGVWTAEMLMIFSMQRPDILSYGDLAIHRGMRMLYHHRKVTPELFAKYKRRYSPYASVASLYLWAIAGGAIPSMQDYAPKTVRGGKLQKQ